MRAVKLLAEFAVALACGLALSAPARATSCKYYLNGFAPLGDGRTYALQVRADDLFYGALKLRLWSATGSYAVDLARVVDIDAVTPGHDAGRTAGAALPPE